MLRTPICLSVMFVLAAIVMSSDRVFGKSLMSTAESQNLLSSLLSAMDNTDSLLKSSSSSSLPKNSHNNIDSSSDDQIELIVNPIGQTNELNRVGGDEAEKVLSSDDLNTNEIDSMVNITIFYE